MYVQNIYTCIIRNGDYYNYYHYYWIIECDTVSAVLNKYLEKKYKSAARCL